MPKRTTSRSSAEPVSNRRRTSSSTSGGTATRGGRVRTLAFGLAASLITIVVVLLFLEVVMRALNIVPVRHARPQTKVVSGGATLPDGRTVPKMDSRLKSLGLQMGEYIPKTVFKTVYDSNTRGYFDAEDNGVLNVINSHGMRGPEFSDQKTTGTFRILAIGDSFTFGYGVRDEDTFIRRMEKQLNGQADSPHYELLNGGAEGYNTRDEVLSLEYRWKDLDPDLVLITFYLNDAYSDFTFLNRGESQALGSEKPLGLAQYSYVYDYAQHAVRMKMETRRIKKYYQKQYFSQADQFLENPGSTNVDWTYSRRALQRASELARERGFRFALVIFPELYSLDENYPFLKIHEHVLETCKEFGIPACDLLTAFKGKKDKDLWVHPADHHPNEVAHKIAAGAIIDFLRTNDLLIPVLSAE